jgi:hypothetical protein
MEIVGRKQNGDSTFTAAARERKESENILGARVARWFTFIPKIPIWGSFGGPWNGNFWYIL